MTYKFQIGDKVFADGRPAEVISCVPGNGLLEWYFVRFEDGTEDRFTAQQLQPR